MIRVGRAPAVWLVVLSALTASACVVRDLDAYRLDIRRLLEARRPIVQACYEAELQTQRKAAGRVVVRFKVERGRGRLVDPRLDDALSTPDRTLRGCVLDSLHDLVLHPPEERDGDATFIWEFRSARD